VRQRRTNDAHTNVRRLSGGDKRAQLIELRVSAIGPVLKEQCVPVYTTVYSFARELSPLRYNVQVEDGGARCPKNKCVRMTVPLPE